MSKSKLIELINASDFDLTYWLAETPVDEVRKVFTQAIKDQDRSQSTLVGAFCQANEKTGIKRETFS